MLPFHVVKNAKGERGREWERERGREAAAADLTAAAEVLNVRAK